jgi:beta-lactamase superfamily II metal-dependent hydrolase
MTVLALAIFSAGPSFSVEARGAQTPQTRKTLDIYFIDVEGGQSTLIVTPAGQSMLVDAGYAGFANRDADRVMAAARDARITSLEYLLVTHFHGDHAGGVPEVARRLPVRTFVDYGEPIEKGAFSAEPFAAYKPLREHAIQLHPKPGDRLPLTGVEIDVLSAGGMLAKTPLAGGEGAGQANPACASLGDLPNPESENPRSLGIRIKFGMFTFLDLGDLPGKNLAALACPTNLIGHIDLYLVPHHGNQDSAIPAVVAATTPRVAILNNGTTKGGDASAFAVLRGAAGIEDTWQLHKTSHADARNFSDAVIANLDDGPNDKGAWIKASAEPNGRFTVTNGRTGLTRTYR